MIQIFCKAPVAGQVKTRLIPQLNPEQAMQLHQRLAWHTFQQVASANNKTVELWCSPNPKHPFFQQAIQQFDFIPQTQMGHDLGVRMGYALQQGLQTTDKVLLCGTDCPQLNSDQFQQAFTQLDNNEVVLIPATDGGYVLIGLRRYHPDLFTNIVWGSDQVLAQTLVKIQALNYRYHCLPALADIDRPQDLDLLKHIN